VATFLLGVGIGAFLGDLRRRIRSRNARVERVRDVLRDGRRLLQAGDVTGARKRREELTTYQLMPDDWEVLSPEIVSFEKAIRSAEQRIRKDGLH
jgi:hypothetical protein